VPRKIRRAAAGVLVAVALLVAAANPAAAAPPPPNPAGAFIQRPEMYLGDGGNPNTWAWMIPVGSRSIVLAKARYSWSNEFYSLQTDRALSNFREINLAAGEYYWNCYIYGATYAIYKSYCYLYHVQTGGYVYTDRLDVNAFASYQWRSQLIKVGNW
jgi:hypothetical protein